MSYETDTTPTRDDDGALLKIAEVGEILNVPMATLRQWRHKGYGPPGFTIGKHLRYRRTDVLAWIDDRRRASA